MWLAVLQLRHGRRSGDAASELSAEEGSDPPFGDASIGIGEGWHVHTHATRPPGVAPVPSSLAGRRFAARREQATVAAVTSSSRLPSWQCRLGTECDLEGRGLTEGDKSGGL